MPNDRIDQGGHHAGSPDGSEPRTEKLGRRDFADDSYGATEREQTRDQRLTDPGPESVEDPEFSDADMANDETGE